MRKTTLLLIALAVATHLPAQDVPTQQATPPTSDAQQIARLQSQLNDWAQLAHYRAANAALPATADGRAVFFGDSITYAWTLNGGKFFPGKPYINRGISGQTTPQMLVRFRQDGVDLQPDAVVILAGTNDIAGNTGPSSLVMIEDNLRSMTEIARGQRHPRHSRYRPPRCRLPLAPRPRPRTENP
jgi:hypothetical protein